MTWDHSHKRLYY